MGKRLKNDIVFFSSMDILFILEYFTVSDSIFCADYKSEDISAVIVRTGCEIHRKSQFLWFLLCKKIAQSAGTVEYTDCFSAEG